MGTESHILEAHPISLKLLQPKLGQQTGEEKLTLKAREHCSISCPSAISLHTYVHIKSGAFPSLL